MKNAIKTIAKFNAIAIAAAVVFVAAPAKADTISGNLGLGVNGSLSSYSGTMQQGTLTASVGGSFAQSGGTNAGTSGSETMTNTTGQATTTSKFENGGINSTSQFKSDSLSQTFGLESANGGFSSSKGFGGSVGGAVAGGNLQSSEIGGAANLGVNGSLTANGLSVGQLAGGLGAVGGLLSSGSGFGKN